MRITFKVVLFSVFLLCSLSTVAQEVQYTLFNTDKNLSFQKVLHMDDDRLLVIYGRERWMELCDYLYVAVHNQAQQQATVFKIPPANNKTILYFKDAIATPTGVWFVFLNYIKAKNTIQVILIPFNTGSGLLDRDKAINLMQIEASDFFNGTFYLIQSPDHQQLGVVTLSGILESYQRRFTMSSVNLKTATVNFTMREQLPSDIHTYQLLKPLIDNQGRYYALVKRFKQAGSELDGMAPNYFYILEHFENNLIRRSTNLMPDAQMIVRYPDAVVVDSSQLLILLPVTDTSLVHIENVILKSYQLLSNTITGSKMISVNNNEPKINSSFITDIYKSDHTTNGVISGQYLEEINGARLTHAYDIIKTYAIILHCNTDDCKSFIIKTRGRIQEELDFIYHHKDTLNMVNYAPNSNNHFEWVTYAGGNENFKKQYSLPAAIWKQSDPYYFTQCNGKTVLIQSSGVRYTIMYLP
ncbi:MAG: hypothetical protein ACK5DY_07860 [Bacteroidota bacterium]